MPAGSLLRYHWAAGTGPAGRARHLLANRPGRRYPRALSVAGGISVAYQGFADGLTYVMPYLHEQLAVVGGEVATGALPPATWPQVRAGEGLPDADLVVTGCSRGRAWRLGPAHAVVLPFRVNLTMPVADDVLTARASITRDERRKFAKLRRRYGWSCEIGTRDADLDDFYDRMHLPTMAARHGEQTRSMAREVARHGVFRRGFVLFVRQGGERVAGVLCRLDDRGRTLRLRLLGVAGGANEHYRTGAARAVYHLAVDWAAEHGVTRLDFAAADPFPGRGVYQYKRRFHPVVGLAGGHHAHRRVHLRVTKDTPAVRDLLAATPMLTTDQAGRLTGTYFHDRDRPVRTDIRLDGSGVDNVRGIDLDDFLAGLRRPVATTILAKQVIAG